MLQYEVARKLYEELQEKITGQPEDVKEFYQDFLISATEYAKTRLSWSFMSIAERRSDDASRSIKHDGYMAMLTAICRNLGIDNIETLMPERKSKGDFACYIAMFLALEQR